MNTLKNEHYLRETRHTISVAMAQFVNRKLVKKISKSKNKKENKECKKIVQKKIIKKLGKNVNAENRSHVKQFLSLFRSRLNETFRI